MIRVTADFNGRTTEHDYDGADGWVHDDRGNLDILKSDDVIASYRWDLWMHVVEVKTEANPEPPAARTSNPWQPS